MNVIFGEFESLSMIQFIRHSLTTYNRYGYESKHDVDEVEHTEHLCSIVSLLLPLILVILPAT